MSRAAFFFPSLVLTSILVGCGGASPEASDAGTGLDSPDRTLTWEPEELYTLGGFAGTDWQEFAQVSTVGFDGEGNLYILDSQASTITVVSSEGEHVRTFGRPGEGPGELSQPMAMVVTPQGEVVISDMGHRGLVRFAADGQWEDNILLDLSTEGIPTQGIYHPSGALVAPEGFRMNFSAGAGSVDTAEEPNIRPLRTYSLDSEIPGSVFYGAWDPPEPSEGGESTLEGGSGQRRMMIRMSRTQAFEPGLSIAVLPDGQVAVVDSIDYTVKVVNLDGIVTRRLQRPISPTQVTDRIRDAERERQLAAAEGGGGIRVFGGNIAFDQDAIKKMMVDQVNNMVFFDLIPVIEDIKSDWQGRIWVQRSSGMPGEDGPTDLITADGQYLGTLPADGVRIPDAFGPGGLIAVIDQDDLDVPVIRVLRVPTEG